MDECVRRLSLRIRLYKVGGTVIHHQALLARYLRTVKKVDCKLVDGFIVTGDNESCWHCWIELGDGSKQDITYHIADIPDTRASLVHQVPDGVVRVDLADERGRMIVDENMRLFDLFQSDEKKFWSEAPPNVKSFRCVK